MIISASRRTDIPAFYGNWFLKRIQAGYCLVRNPFNPNQCHRIELNPERVDCIVFWTRFSDPFLKKLKIFSRDGFRFYFLYILTGYNQHLEPGVPGIRRRLKSFFNLVDQIGPEKVIWRYDPILISRSLTFDWHLRMFEFLSGELHKKTFRVILSFVDAYQKTQRNLFPIDDEFNFKPETEAGFARFIRKLVEIANSAGMEIVSCAEQRQLEPLGLCPGNCIDSRWINRLFGTALSYKKDPQSASGMWLHCKQRYRCL